MLAKMAVVKEMVIHLLMVAAVMFLAIVAA
jgi:hypothetical protein